MDKQFTVYCIENLINNKKYIGVTTSTIEHRWSQHKRRPMNVIIKQAFEKYGIDNFYISTVFNAVDQKIMLEMETFFIKELNTMTPNGYNLTTGGEHHVASDELKDRFKVINKKIWESKEKRNVHSKIMKNYYEKHPEKASKPKEIKDINGVLHKECNTCKQSLSLDKFGSNKRKYLGKSNKCYECTNLKNRLDRGGNKVSRLKQPKIYVKDDPEWKKSYEDRKDAISKAIKAKYINDPRYKDRSGKLNGKPILRYGTITKDIKEYPTALAAKEDGFNNSCIGVAIKMGKKYKGYYWKFK